LSTSFFGAETPIPVTTLLLCSLHPAGETLRVRAARAGESPETPDPFRAAPHPPTPRTLSKPQPASLAYPLSPVPMDQHSRPHTVPPRKSDLVIVEDAALSRLKPIPDGPDQWEIHRSSEGTGSGGPAAHPSLDNVAT
jgi:hypothetical protein